MADEIAQPGQEPEDDIVVEVDAPEAVDEAAVEGGTEPKVVSPEEGVAALKARLEEESRAKAEALEAKRLAEERASQHERLAQTARGSEIEGRLGQIASALETVKAQAEASERAYAEALAQGDYAKAAKVQREMARQENYVERLEEGRRQLEAAKAAPPRPAQPQQRPAPPADPFERFVASLAPRAQEWVRAHPDYIRDPNQNKRLVAAHANAVLEHEEGSDGYYAAVEKQLGLDKPAAPAKRAPAPVAAPVSRGQASLSRPAEGSGRQTVKLTPDEVAMAKAMGVDLKDYARQKAAVAAEVARGEHRQ